MAHSDYFFLIFLGTIAATRLFLAISKTGSPTLGTFRLRHYMYGIGLIIIAVLIQDLTLYAIGFGLLMDELPLIVLKGPGHREQHWRGCEDYDTPWCVSGVLILIFIVYVFRNAIAGLI